MLLIGTGLIVAQLAFRAWAVYGAWFQFDDFAWISQSLNASLSIEFVFQEYAGHLMPGGYLLSWLYAHIDPLNYLWPSTTLLVLQAIASFGCLRLLRHMFGERPAILVPLCLYLFSVISLPAYIWWAAGINALPLQIALFYGLHSHVSYLRSGRITFAVRAMAWTVFGLFFFEKTLFVYIAYALVALSYFATGWGFARVVFLWREYRPGMILYGSVLGGYLTAYCFLALNFDPNEANNHPLAPVAAKLVGQAFGSGIVGGPLRWFSRPPFSTVADPSDVIVVLSWLAIAAIVFELARTRTRTKRAWLLVIIVLVVDVLLVGAARAAVVGPGIAMEYRYQTEVTAFAAIALALASMPLLGAREPSEAKEASPFLESRDYVGLATLVFCGVALLSNYQYATRWQSDDDQHTFFDNLEQEVQRLRDDGTSVDLPNTVVPEFVLWGLSYPENQQMRVLRMFDGPLQYPDRTDDLRTIDDQGFIEPALVTPVRNVPPGPKPNCGYFVRSGPVEIALDGPVIGGGWWIRLGYIASRTGTLEVVAGNHTYVQPLSRGLGETFFRVDGDFDSLTLRTDTPKLKVCTDDITLGLPVPAESP